MSTQANNVIYYNDFSLGRPPQVTKARIEEASTVGTLGDPVGMFGSMRCETGDPVFRVLDLDESNEPLGPFIWLHYSQMHPSVERCMEQQDEDRRRGWGIEDVLSLAAAEVAASRRANPAHAVGKTSLIEFIDQSFADGDKWPAFLGKLLLEWGDGTKRMSSVAFSQLMRERNADGVWARDPTIRASTINEWLQLEVTPKTAARTMHKIIDAFSPHASFYRGLEVKPHLRFRHHLKLHRIGNGQPDGGRTVQELIDQFEKDHDRTKLVVALMDRSGMDLETLMNWSGGPTSKYREYKIVDSRSAVKFVSLLNPPTLDFNNPEDLVIVLQNVRLAEIVSGKPLRPELEHALKHGKYEIFSGRLLPSRLLDMVHAPNTADRIRIGDAFRQMRLAKGLQQDDFGVSKSVVFAFEKGKKFLKLHTAREFANKLELTDNIDRRRFILASTDQPMLSNEDIMDLVESHRKGSLRALLHQTGLPFDTLAQIIGTSPQSFSAWVRRDMIAQSAPPVANIVADHLPLNGTRPAFESSFNLAFRSPTRPGPRLTGRKTTDPMQK